MKILSCLCLMSIINYAVYHQAKKRTILPWKITSVSPPSFWVLFPLGSPVTTVPRSAMPPFRGLHSQREGHCGFRQFEAHHCRGSSAFRAFCEVCSRRNGRGGLNNSSCVCVAHAKTILASFSDFSMLSLCIFCS